MSIDQTRGDGSPEFTGRFLVTGAPNRTKETAAALKNAAGLSLASSLDFDGQAVDAAALEAGDGLYLDELGIAIVSAADEDQLARVSALETMPGTATAVEPERVVYALGDTFADYIRGYRDAVNSLALGYADSFGGGEEEPEAEAVGAEAVGSTWGLRKTKTVVGFPFTQFGTGEGIRVAVLDTGMDLAHPDFAGRAIVGRSFVPGEEVQDGHRHGTHCIGTACGPKEPADASIQRYGVAWKASIFAGKVLSNAGSGTDGSILSGINWAIAQGCQVISMSLGAPANDAGFSAAYENAAQIAMNRGTLIVAAAGNDTNRPVGHPANCPSIMAVGAVDEALVKAGFSNITFFPPQGKVDIVGPGVGVFSSVPVAFGRYGTLSGTSMATPHVAGIAALHAQANPQLRGAALWQRLIATAMPLPNQPVTHVGAGLVQAPFRNLGVKPIPVPFPFPRPIPPIKRPIPLPDPAPAAHHVAGRKRVRT